MGCICRRQWVFRRGFCASGMVSGCSRVVKMNSCPDFLRRFANGGGVSDLFARAGVIPNLHYFTLCWARKASRLASNCSRDITTLAGQPATTVLGATSLATTLPPPTTAFSPTVTPGQNGDSSTDCSAILYDWRSHEAAFGVLVV